MPTTGQKQQFTTHQLYHSLFGQLVQTAPLARERDEPVQAAAVAVKPREPPRVPKTRSRQMPQAVAAAQPGRLGHERLEVILHDPMKDAVGGRFVARGRFTPQGRAPTLA
jgi:hypothetical protein